ncbi:discoidin domain-containing protein [Clostridium carnis]
MNLTTKKKLAVTSALLCTMSMGLISCTGNGATTKANYRVTEEGVNVDMLNAPISSFWFPEDLLEWNPNEDKDFNYNKSVIPLAKRVDKENLSPVNETQNKDTNVVAISIMNASTSGNPSQGSNKFAANTFSYWQYIDKLVYWGGSSGEGIIVPPSPDVTDSAHKNGVKVLGTVFFPMTEHGGKIEWLNKFLEKDSNGNFPMVDKLIEVCKTYNFDGWFINQETEPTEKAPVTKEHAALMQEFIKEFKKKSENTLEIMWYDSMTKDGAMDWQNALTDKNDYFLIDGDKESVADSMFLNFWWTYKKYAEQELLKKSKQKAEEVGVNPYDLYAGIDVQANGTGTKVNWGLFEDSEGKPYTSLGLYCPSWTFFSSQTIEEYEDKESRLWVNEFGDPTMETQAKDKEWRGVSKYAIEKTVVNSLPFTTNFNIGNGYNFFINGEVVSKLDWNNRSLADVMPTYRWIIENEGNNKLKARMDFSNAFYGGNSIKFSGNLEANKSSVIKLFSADMQLEKGTKFTTTAKAESPINLDLVLEFQDGETETIKASEVIGKEWTTVSYDLKNAYGKSIKTISYKVTSDESKQNMAINLGNITINNGKNESAVNVKNLKVEDTIFVEDDMFTGVRLSWDGKDNEKVRQYEVYRVNEDKTKSFLGATPNNSFYVSSLKREDNSNKTTFEVVAVNESNVRGKSATAKIEWPDNSKPKANFKVSKTLVAPGEEITFESTSNLVTENVEWKFEGADTETSTEKNPVVKYSKEGVYSVTLTAKNKKGKDVKVSEELITVTDKAKSGLKNLALNKKAEASSFVNNNEAPQFSVDDKLDTKWCAVGSDIHNITIDLGEVKTISELHIAHAEAGGENPNMNTSEYKLEVSTDGVEFTPVVEVIKNSAGKTVDAFKATEARYVKLSVLKATQGSDSAARIYEIGIYGLE